MPITIQYITGPAGSGKSFLIRQRMEEAQAQRKLMDKVWARSCATTGVAAMNLGTITLHSLLKFFNPLDLERSRRRIYRVLDDLDCETIIVDEASMLDANLFTLMVRMLDDYGDINLILSGDFAQLPPVEGQFTFNSPEWPRVEVERLTKIHRQDNPQFLEALALARKGFGPAAAQILAKLCEFSPTRDHTYPGICLVATRAEAASVNAQNLEALAGDWVVYSPSRWGKQLSDWKQIPDATSLKPGCKVRIRSNDVPDFKYVNGDTGILILDEDHSNKPFVRLDRDAKVTVEVRHAVRYNEVTQDEADDLDESEVRYRRWFEPDGTEHNQPYVGSVRFMPLEAGYASTVHTAQGLTLDSAQVSLSGLTSFNFNRGFGQNLAYVALSRVRTPERLRIHGTPQSLGAKIKIHPQVNPWI